VFPVGAVEIGYLFDIPARGPIGVRAGGAAGLAFVPDFIAPDYGGVRPRAFWLFLETRLR
jgi:hypothetical protein